MIKWAFSLILAVVLSSSAFAQTNTPTTATSKSGNTDGFNENLVTHEGKKVGDEFWVFIVTDNKGKEVSSMAASIFAQVGWVKHKPGTARITRSDGQVLEAFALTRGVYKDAIVGYWDNGTLMVRQQDGKQLGKVFAPRVFSKLKTVSKKAIDNTTIFERTYDGRPVTEAESFVFDAVGWTSSR